MRAALAAVALGLTACVAGPPAAPPGTATPPPPPPATLDAPSVCASRAALALALTGSELTSEGVRVSCLAFYSLRK